MALFSYDDGRVQYFDPFMLDLVDDCREQLVSVRRKLGWPSKKLPKIYYGRPHIKRKRAIINANRKANVRRMQAARAAIARATGAGA